MCETGMPWDCVGMGVCGSAKEVHSVAEGDHLGHSVGGREVVWSERCCVEQGMLWWTTEGRCQSPRFPSLC